MKTGGYFDNSATTKPCEEAVSMINDALRNNWGNPSSLYDLGIAAESVLEKTRTALAKTVSCRPDEVYFTSGGTEANNIALFGAAGALKRRGNRVVVSEVEHSSVLEAADELEKRGFEIMRLKPGSDGIVAKEEIDAAINSETILVSLMLVNNETGAIQPVRFAADALKKAGAPGLLHCDCVQALGKYPFKAEETGADLISVSGHKIHGPKGVGALIKRRDARILPLTFGGGQEKKLRPGTEPVPLVAGFCGALSALPDLKKQAEITAELKKYINERLLKIAGVRVNSSDDGIPYILNLSVPGIRSETMLHFLEEREIYVSSGSACSKGKGSHVLRAMGLPQEIVDSAIRVSFSRFNTPEQADALCAGIEEAVSRLRRQSRNKDKIIGVEIID